MKQVSRDLLDFIDMHDSFYIIGHREPDGDCVGSQLALASFLQRIGKSAYPLSAGPFTKPEVMGFENRFGDSPPPEKTWERQAAIVVDCSSLSRTGDLADRLPPVPIAFIDHHSAADTRNNVAWVDEKAASVTSMILVLIETMGSLPTREEAELLFYGLCTDTGFFRHPDESGAEAFEIAAKLVRAGASPKKAHAAMYGGKTLASRMMMGEILARITPCFGGRLLVSWVTLEDQQKYGKASRDPDVIYQLMMGVAGCEAAMMIRQEDEAGCTVGLRSRDRINVAQIAAAFGGGGHRLAAGLTIPGHIDDVRERMIQAFSPAFV